MKMFGAFTKVEQQDDGTLLVEGIASTEAVDSDGEVVKATAIKAALPDFLKYGTGALREMHQPIAAGRVDTAAQADDGRTAITATVVDPVAVKKVLTGVYKGFSIGGKVTARDTANKATITGLRLTEISLVDRPANPEAIITLVKLEDDGQDEAGGAGSDDQGQAAPAQVWDCRGGAMGGCEAHSHAKKADAITCIADQALAKRRAPLDAADAAAAELVALTKGAEAATSDAPDPDHLGELRKYLGEQAWDAQAAIGCLSALYQLLGKESAESEPQPDQIAALKDAVQRLKDFISSEIQEPDDADLAMAAAIDGLEKAGARHGKADAARVQKLHDTAVDLGANCGAEKHEHVEDLAKAQGLLADATAERDQALEKLAALTKAANTAAARIKELEAMPRAEDYVVKTAVALNGIGQEDATPTTALDAIKKAQRSPGHLAPGF